MNSMAISMIRYCNNIKKVSQVYIIGACKWNGADFNENVQHRSWVYYPIVEKCIAVEK